MTENKQDKRRAYMREYKRKQRADPNYVEPKDNRTAEDRRDYMRQYMRDYRAKRKQELKDEKEYNQTR